VLECEHAIGSVSLAASYCRIESRNGSTAVGVQNRVELQGSFILTARTA